MCCLKRNSLSQGRKIRYYEWARLYLCTLICPTQMLVYEWCFFGNRCRRTLWRTTSYRHDHTTTWNFFRSGDMNGRNLGRTLKPQSLSLPRLPCPLKHIMASYLTLSEVQLQSTPLTERMINLKCMGWGCYVRRLDKTDRNLKILWRGCTKRAPNPNIKKQMGWKNVEQTTNTYIRIHAWKLKTLWVINKEAFTRT